MRYNEESLNQQKWGGHSESILFHVKETIKNAGDVMEQ